MLGKVELGRTVAVQRPAKAALLELPDQRRVQPSPLPLLIGVLEPPAEADVPIVPGDPGDPDLLRVADPDIPLVNLGPVSIPLYGPAGGTWALVNLILSIIGVALAFASTIRAILRRKREWSEEEQEIRAEETELESEYIRESFLESNAQTEVDPAVEAAFAHLADERAASEAREKQKKRQRRAWLLIANIGAIIGVVLFLLTQNIRLPMVLVDFWTIAHLVLFAVGIAATYCLYKRDKKDADKDRDMTAGGDDDEMSDVRIGKEVHV